MPSFQEYGDGYAGAVQQIVLSTSDIDYIDHLIPIIKDYGSRSQQTGQLMQALDNASASREAEIEKICSSNHQDFVTSVNQLQNVREGSLSLTGEILSLSNSIETSTEQLAQQKKALVDSRHVRDNIDETTSALHACLDVLQLSNKVHELLTKQNYHAALRALDELQTVHLREVTRYNVADMIEKSVPATQRRIAEEVMNDLNTWLFRVRESGQTAGYTAFILTEERRQRQKDRASQDEALVHFNLNSAVEAVADEMDETNFLHNDEVEIGLDYLYEAFYIFQLLGETDRFRHEFASNRRKQKELLFDSVTSLADTEALSTLLEEIAGFAILEDALLTKTENLRTQADVDELWYSMCHSAVDLITPFMDTIDNDEELLRIKAVMALFSQTMQSVGYSVKIMESLNMTAFDKYAAIFKARFTEDFNELMASDDYMPMTIANQKEYDYVLDFSWYVPSSTRAVTFPCVLPFSQMYVLSCANMKSYITKMYTFIDGIFESSNVIDETIRTSLDELLCDIVCRSLSERLATQYPGQIVQILTNIKHLEMACHEVEDILVQARSASSVAGPIHLRATAAFGEAKTKAEGRIFKVVNSKIDDLVETAEYDWTTTQKPDEPLPYMQELTRYLSNIMTSVLLGLPTAMKEQIYSEALLHISNALLALPLEESVQAISPQAMTAYSLDVNHLITFVSALNDAKLLSGLDQLKQTVELMSTASMSSDQAAEEFFDAEKARQRFGRVDRAHGAQLLEKIAQGHSEEFQRQTTSPAPTSEKKTTAMGAIGNIGFSNFSSRFGVSRQ